MIANANKQYIKIQHESAVAAIPKKPKVNLLIDIPQVVRVIIIVYFLIYQFFFPLKVIFNGQSLDASITSCINILTALLSILPIVLKWPGIGLLHPFVWPVLFGIGKSVKSPANFIKPFIDVPGPISQQVVLTPGMGEDMKLAIFTLLAVLFTYAGYLLTKNTKFNLRPKIHKSNIRTKLIWWSVICSAIAFGFFMSQGGIQAWINSWGILGGRTEAMENLGPILAFIGGLYYIPTIWIFCKNKEVLKDPVFWFFAVIFALCGFLANGSRYGILQALTTYLMAWVLINRNFPIVKVILGGVVFVMLFGMLGMLRSSATYHGSAADWSVLSQDASTYLDYAVTEGTRRSQEKPDLQVMRKVPREVDYLYGKSYLYLIATYVPRFLWPDKPHSGAYYTGRLIFNVKWGIPVEEIGEVYWNFGALGFLLFFMFKGFIYKVFVNTFTHYTQYGAAVILYFMFLFSGGSFDSLTLADLVRELLYVFIGLKFLQLL